MVIKRLSTMLWTHGANFHALNRVKVDAFRAALYGKKYNHLQIIHDLGHTVQKYGGKASEMPLQIEIMRF